MAVAVPVLADYFQYPDSKLVALLVGSYLISLVHTGLPIKNLSVTWLESQWLFYGSVGGEIRFDSMLAATKWRSMLIILTGVAVRFVTALAVLFIEFRQDHALTLKEKKHLAISWCPKAGGQGLLAY